jgi:hypothetical protein
LLSSSKHRGKQKVRKRRGFNTVWSNANARRGESERTSRFDENDESGRGGRGIRAFRAFRSRERGHRKRPW